MIERMGLNEDTNVTSTNLCSYGSGKVVFVADFVGLTVLCPMHARYIELDRTLA